MSNKTVDLNLTIEEYLEKLSDETEVEIHRIINTVNKNFDIMYFNTIHSFLYFVYKPERKFKAINDKKYPKIFNKNGDQVCNDDDNLACVENFFPKQDKSTFEQVTKDISKDCNLRDFFYEFWKHIIEKTSVGGGVNYKKTMKDYIKEVFGINMDDRLMKNKLRKLIENGTKQIILHGAPGTGKTFTAENFAEEYVTNLYEGLKKNNPDLEEGFDKFKDKYIKKVQFHPSFDYTDFVEGLRPAIIEKDKTDKSNTKTDKSPTFVRMDGILKKFCRKIIENNDSNNLYFLLIDEINRADLSKVLGDLMYLMNDPQRSKKDKDEKKKIETPYSNMPTYVVDDNGNGKFLDNPNDKDKKDQNDNGKKEQNDNGKKDQNDNDKKDIFHDGFYLPDNLIIIGTMNDIDRSVDAFDFALRRRFVWIEADANTEAKEAIKAILENKINKDEIKKLSDRLEELNKVISGEEGKKLGLSEKYHIGHAYAKNFDGSYDTLWENSIKPVLDDYCLGKKNKDSFIKACENALKEKSQSDNQASSGN